MTNVAYIEHYTIDDYKFWEGKWELIDGVPYAMSPFAKPNHQFVSGQLYSRLQKLTEQCENCYVLMESEWIINEDTVVRPDVLVVCDIDLDEVIQKPPKVIFEVVSPSSRRRDEQLKFDLYRQEGVEYYGLVYLKSKMIKLYHLEGGNYIQQLRSDGKFHIAFEGCEAEVALEGIFPN